MTRILPKEPNIDHLKNEAKALLKSHNDGNRAACGILRRLHRFDGASDETILAASVKLAEAQFALAQDYGFASWPALRKAIPPQRRADFAPDARQDAVILPDIPAGGMGHDRSTAGLTMLLEYLGAMVAHVTVTGDLGKAFIFQADALHKPFGADVPTLDIGWWPLDKWGLNHRLEFLGNAHGIALRQLACNMDEYKADPARHYQQYFAKETAACLQAARPVVAIGADHHLVVGLDSGEPPLLGQLTCLNEVKVTRIGEYPYDVIVPGQPGQAMDRREIDRESLRYAVRLGRDQEDLSHLPGKSSGRKSWLLWAEQLKDEDLAGHHYYSANVVGHLRGHRRCASQYLRRMTDRHPPKVAALLNQAAETYDQVHALLGKADTSKEGWATGREAIITLIHDILPLEAKAQDCMADAVERMAT